MVLKEWYISIFKKKTLIHFFSHQEASKIILLMSLSTWDNKLIKIKDQIIFTYIIKTWKKKNWESIMV